MPSAVTIVTPRPHRLIGRLSATRSCSETCFQEEWHSRFDEKRRTRPTIVRQLCAELHPSKAGTGTQPPTDCRRVKNLTFPLILPDLCAARMPQLSPQSFPKSGSANRRYRHLLPEKGETSLSRNVGQIIARGERRWLVRVYVGRDRETRKRTYHNRTVYGSLRHPQA